VRTAAAETNAATAAMGVLFFEMMFLWEDEAIAEEKGRWRRRGSFIDDESMKVVSENRNNVIY
jgi:hypothetical protein